MATPQHPIGSGFGAHTTAAEVLSGIDLSGRLAIVTGGYSGTLIEFKTPEQGAATATWAATAPALDRMGGVYCEDCDVADLAAPGTPEAADRGVDPHAVDPDAAARLWTVSAELTGVNAFATA
jgi:hypothetical protein